MVTGDGQRDASRTCVSGNGGEIRQTTFLDNLPAVTVYNRVRGCASVVHILVSDLSLYPDTFHQSPDSVHSALLPAVPQI